MEKQAYTLAELEAHVAKNTHNMQCWVASRVRSQKDFMVYSKQALWLASEYQNFLPLQDISNRLESLATVTGDVVSYNKQFVRLIRQMAGGIVNIDGIAYYDNKQSALTYKNKTWALAEGYTWADIRPCFKDIPKTTLKILEYMKIKTMPAKANNKYIRIQEGEFIDLLAELDIAIQEGNINMVQEIRNSLAEYYKN